MDPSNYNSIAIDAQPYVERLAQRLRWAHRWPRGKDSAAVIAEARDYLLHRRIRLPKVSIPTIDRLLRRVSEPDAPGAPQPPPPPTFGQIDAVFEQRRKERVEPRVEVYHLDCHQPTFRAQPSRRKRIPSVPKPRKPRTPKPKPIPEPVRDVAFYVVDKSKSQTFTGPSLLGLAMGLRTRHISTVTVWVARGRHPIHDLSDPTRPAFNCGDYLVSDLFSDVSLRHFLSSVP